MRLQKNAPPSDIDFAKFVSKVEFQIPKGYLKFMKESNGAYFDFEMRHLELWALTELFFLNEEYEVEKFAPAFFLIGSDGSGMAFGINKSNGKFYEIPFIGMNDKEAVYISNHFNGFLNELNK
jgi:hypothetical protein